jgi:hypothetical protein
MPWHCLLSVLFYALYRWVNCQDNSTWDALSLYLNHWVSSDSTDNPNSETLLLSSYLYPSSSFSSGEQDWQQVRIPLSDFIASSSSWQLGGVEALVFNLDSEYRSCVVDNIALIDLLTPLLYDIQVETSDIVSFNMSKRFLVTDAQNLTQYSLSSRNGDLWRPVDAASSIQVAGWNEEQSLLSAYRIYLKFPYRMLEGIEYTLHITSDFHDAAKNNIEETSFSFNYTDFREVTSIQINQEGYTTHSPKIGYVQGYFTDMGSAAFTVGSDCTVLRRDKFSLLWTAMQVAGSCESDDTDLFAVRALSETHAYAVGAGGTILHWNGNGNNTWYPMSPPASASSSSSNVTLLALDFSPGGHAVAVGTNASIWSLPYGSDEWVSFTPYPSADLLPSDALLRSVYIHTDGTITVVGDAILLDFDGSSSWTAHTSALATLSLHSACGTRQVSSYVYAFGNTGTSVKYQYGNVNVPLKADVYSDVDWRGCWMSAGKYDQHIVVGSNGTVRVYDDSSSPVDVGIDKKDESTTFYDVNCVSTLDCIAVGSRGTIASGATSDALWTVSTLPLRGNVTLHSVATVPAGSLRLAADQRTVKLLSLSVNASGSHDEATYYHEVAAYDLSLRRHNDQLSGGDLWEFDFTSVTEAGKYQLLIDGIGMSTTFSIGDDALNDAAWHSCRSFFYMRSGTDLKQPPYADPRWTHGLDHEFDPNGRLIDGAYHWSIAESPLYFNETVCPLENSSCSLEAMKDTAGG